MSEDFDVVCRTCTNADAEKRAEKRRLGWDHRTELGLSDWNHRWADCWVLIDAAAAFSMLAERLHELSIVGASVQLRYKEDVDVDWFNIHFGHDLGVISEYGWRVDRDGEPIMGDPTFPHYSERK